MPRVQSNPFFLYAARWIASRNLSSGAHSRGPSARNGNGGKAAAPSIESDFFNPSIPRVSRTKDGGLGVAQRKRRVSMSLPCLEVRRSARARAAAVDRDSAAIISELAPDHPVGTKATVTHISLKRALHPDEPFLSTFIVDYLPGGSAGLLRSPSAGYVLVHVLSGTIRAQAWEAGMGTYRFGQTWVEPAVANEITPKNASAVEPARALVVLITNETTSLQPKDH
jgi:hypothetical protein